MKPKLTQAEKLKVYQEWQAEIAAKIKKIPWYKPTVVERDGKELLN